MKLYLQFGSLHVPILGICAALGLVLALLLSQRTARYAQLNPEAVWNASVTAIISAFTISRLLLIAFNLRSFLQYPFLVLALPSITTTGIVLTALFMLAYLRWRRLPLLPLLDSLAPCAALLWAFLSLGRVIDGTRDGMPMQLPQSHGHAVHPVEFYTFIAASVIGVFLFSTLRSSIRSGQTAAVALVASGVAIFFIDFFRLPTMLIDDFPLEPSQIIGVAMVLAGAALVLRKPASILSESGTEPPHAV